MGFSTGELSAATQHSLIAEVSEEEMVGSVYPFTVMFSSYAAQRRSSTSSLAILQPKAE